ncbi:Uncharacterised protein [uncultured archaeon]|nr:Uncharacterised protein [uncultured archaeon]
MEVAHLRHAAGAVSVKIYGEADLLLDLPDQVVGILRGDQSRHILDADGIAAQLCQLNRKQGELLVSVHRAQCIADSALHVLFHFLGCSDRSLHVADVVHGIEDPEDIDAVCGRLLHKSIHNIVGIMSVSDQILSAKQHLHRSVWHGLLQRPKPLPRVFIQIPNAGIECRSAPHFQREESNLVHLLRNGEHVSGSHPGGQERLVSISKNRVCKLNPAHEDLLLYGPSYLKPLRPSSHYGPFESLLSCPDLLSFAFGTSIQLP